MDLDARQLRSFFTAGTVAFPRPYPTLGRISFQGGRLTLAPAGQPQNKDLVIVYEYQPNGSIVRTILQEDVSAIFVPGERDAAGAFTRSEKPYAESLERGEWFIGDDVNAAAVRARLNLQAPDVSGPNSVLRGIVYVPKDRPILKVTEVAQTAGAEAESPEEICCCCRGIPTKICCC
jgi:hypothetical protein